MFWNIVYILLYDSRWVETELSRLVVVRSTSIRQLYNCKLLKHREIKIFNVHTLTKYLVYI